MAIVRLDGITYITRSVLRDRGWSPKMITSFAEPPDDITRDPQYGSLTRLYDLSRVESIEQSQEWQEALHDSRTKRARSVIDLLEECTKRDRKQVSSWIKKHWAADA